MKTALLLLGLVGILLFPFFLEVLKGAWLRRLPPDEAAKRLAKMRPDRAGEAFGGMLDPSRAAEVLAMMEPNAAARVLIKALDPEGSSSFRAVYDVRGAKRVAEILAEMLPYQAAKVLSEVSSTAVYMQFDESPDVLDLHTWPKMAFEVLHRLPLDRADELLAKMTAEEAANVLAQKPQYRAEKMLARMPQDDAALVREWWKAIEAQETATVFSQVADTTKTLIGGPTQWRTRFSLDASAMQMSSTVEFQALSKTGQALARSLGYSKEDQVVLVITYKKDSIPTIRVLGKGEGLPSLGR